MSVGIGSGVRGVAIGNWGGNRHQGACLKPWLYAGPTDGIRRARLLCGALLRIPDRHLQAQPLHQIPALLGQGEKMAAGVFRVDSTRHKTILAVAMVITQLDVVAADGGSMASGLLCNVGANDGLAVNLGFDKAHQALSHEDGRVRTKLSFKDVEGLFQFGGCHVSLGFRVAGCGGKTLDLWQCRGTAASLPGECVFRGSLAGLFGGSFETVQKVPHCGWEPTAATCGLDVRFS